jgi:hypothetical protein
LPQIGCQSPEEEVQMSTPELSEPGGSEYHQQPRMILQDMLTPKPSQSGIYVFFMTMQKKIKKKFYSSFYKQKILIKKKRRKKGRTKFMFKFFFQNRYCQN